MHPQTRAPGERFTVVRWREGYAIEEVDAFVERCFADLSRGAHGDLTAATVRDVRFTPRRFRAGYDMDEVDVYLDEVLTELNRLRGPQTS